VLLNAGFFSRTHFIGETKRMAFDFRDFYRVPLQSLLWAINLAQAGLGEHHRKKSKRPN
jgi:hypothetical protein